MNVQNYPFSMSFFKIQIDVCNRERNYSLSNIESTATCKTSYVGDDDDTVETPPRVPSPFRGWGDCVPE